MFAAETAGRAQSGQIDVTDELTGQAVKFDPGGNVLEIGADELVIDQVGPFQ